MKQPYLGMQSHWYSSVISWYYFGNRAKRGQKKKNRKDTAALMDGHDSEDELDEEARRNWEASEPEQDTEDVTDYEQQPTQNNSTIGKFVLVNIFSNNRNNKNVL